MKKQIHYQTEEQILKEIRHQREKIVRLHKEAEELEATPMAYEEAKTVKVRKMRQRAANIENNRIPKLIRVLAAYRTEPMPFLNGDRSVVEVK